MPSITTLPFWFQSTMFSLFIYWLAITYNFLYSSSLSFAEASESIAFVAGILLGCSFGLSGMSYFFNFLDTKLKYRKYFGLLGFYLACVYCLSLMIRFPELYGTGLWSRLFELEVFLGLGAMSILTMMAIISDIELMKKLGTHWRPLLRLGYLAYMMLIIRAWIVEGQVWSTWLSNLQTVPPPRLLLTIFAVVMLLLRFIMEISIRMKKQESKTVSSVQPVNTPTNI